jgi:hypothetical protein
MQLRLEFKPQDLWIGVYFAQCEDSPYIRTDVWICLLPCVPIHLWWNQEA